MPKSPNSIATESHAATVDTVEGAPPDQAMDVSAIVADDAEPRPATADAADPTQADTGNVGRRNGRVTTVATAAPADGPDAPTAVMPRDPGNVAASAGAQSIGDNAADSVPGRVWNALLAHRGATAAELATAAEVGRSTVSKLLATWAEEGRTTSAAGANARAARQWTADLTSADLATVNPVTVDPVTVDAATTQQRDADADQRPRSGQRRRAGDAMNRAADIKGGVDGPLTDSAAGGRGRRRSAASTAGEAAGSVTSAAPVPVPGTNRTGSVRLGAGALRGQVEEFLAEHPGEHGPVEIGHVLRRSSGAIANALERLVETGWAERTSERPKRYRYADADEADTFDSDDDADEADTLDSDGGGEDGAVGDAEDVDAS